MRELHVEYKGTNAYLVYTIAADDEIDSLSLGMLTNNEIEGIIPTQYIQMDDTRQLLFNISNRVSVAHLFKSPVKKKRLVGILSGIVTALLSADEYMLEPQSFLMELEYIFVDIKTAETAVVCLPLANVSNGSHNLKSLFKDIMYQAQFDQTEGYDHIAQILNFINSSSDLSLCHFKNLLDRLSDPKQQSSDVIVNTPPDNVNLSGDVGTHGGNGTDHSGKDGNAHGIIGMPPSELPPEGPSGDEPEISLFGLLKQFNPERLEKYKEQQRNKKDGQQKGKGASKKDKKGQRQEADVGFGVDFAIPGYEERVIVEMPSEISGAFPAEGKQVVAEHIDYGMTVLLTDDGGATQVGIPTKPHLIWRKTGEKILIDTDHFLIGRKQNEVNFCIRNNKTVGRMHAVIVVRDGEFFVCDLDSANHTYINGTEIPPNQEVSLTHGCMLMFSDEEFEFCMI